jgi:hypothetical protein
MIDVALHHFCFQLVKNRRRAPRPRDATPPAAPVTRPADEAGSGEPIFQGLVDRLGGGWSLSWLVARRALGGHEAG